MAKVGQSAWPNAGSSLERSMLGAMRQGRDWDHCSHLGAAVGHRLFGMGHVVHEIGDEEPDDSS
jgi:hypothetical protein